jgi:ribosomal protein S12 methylthiotransferase
MADSRAPRVSFVSLGCPKALVDSERIITRLRAEGYELTRAHAGADLAIVNTCGFLDSAQEESLAAIGAALNENGKVIVTGCMGAEPEKITARYPGVLAVTGPQQYESVVDAVHLVAPPRHDPFLDLVPPEGVKLTPRHYAYLKISEGCDRLCTFCAIPGMRGKHVTKPIEEVLREARELAADGVRELIVVAQDTTYYGMDLYGRVRLAELLRQLDQVDGIEWIRILYAYPIHFNDELIKTLSTARKIVPYLDLPLQHINDRVLRRMQRKVNRQSTEDLLVRLRHAIPGLALRTTFIVGFPGETEAEFEELEAFARATRFERVGVFPYSLEPGTPAARLEGHLRDDVKADRQRRLMECQQEVAFDWSRRQIGREIDVIVDRPEPELPNHVLARSYADAPDIDGVVRVKGKGIHAGDLVRVKVTGADGYDLLARAITQGR